MQIRNFLTPMFSLFFFKESKLYPHEGCASKKFPQKTCLNLAWSEDVEFYEKCFFLGNVQRTGRNDSSIFPNFHGGSLVIYGAVFVIF